MTDAPTTDRGVRRQRRTPDPRAARVRAIIFLVAALAVLAGAVFVYVQYQQGEAERAAQYERNAAAAAPAGFSDQGIKLSNGDGREVVIMADLSCPHCQDFFESDGEALERVVASGEHTVWLQVLDVRSHSSTNEIALGYFFDAVAKPAADPLAVYRAISRAITDLDDDADSTQVKDAIRDELTSVTPDPPVEAPEPTTRQERWLSARTYENRESEGSVPAATVDGEGVDVEDLVGLLD